MPSKFLNISVDNTLGGASPSDQTVSSQKAIKDYVDGNYVTISTTQTISGSKTFTEPVTIQNGQGTGCLIVGANVNSSTLSNNQRKLARINAPSYANKDLSATLIGWDTSGDSDSPVTNKSYDSVCFGGMKKITNCTSPMSITFCVTDTRAATAAANKKYALAMDANAAIFSVQPKYGSYNLATTNDLPTVNDATITITQGGVTKGSFTLNQSSAGTIALDAGGGSVDIDGVSITKNSDDELQTVGVIDQNNTSNALKQWTGTKAQYDAIVTKDANTIYNITDDTTPSNFANTSLSNLDATGQAILSSKVDLASGVSQSDVDYVVASQLPTAENDYTWYRLYKSGWIEQGGITQIPSRTNSGNSQKDITFPVSMNDSMYNAQISFQGGGAYYANSQLTFTNKATTGTKIEFYVNVTGTTASFPVAWEVKGMSAQGGS